MSFFYGFNLIWNSIVLDLTILWIIIPVLFTWLFIILYFGKFKDEEMNWGGFLQNSLALTWITFSSLRGIFSAVKIDFLWIRFSILCFILVYSISLFYFSYTHRGPLWFGYLAMPTPINFMAFVAIIFSNPLLVINSWLFFSFFIIFLTMLLVSFIARLLLPEADLY